MIKNVLVSVSGSPNSLMATKYAICLARVMQTKLFVVYVIDSKVLSELLKSRIFVEAEARAYERDLEQQGKVFLERIKKMADSRAVACETFLLKGSVSEEVINKINEVGADMLVMGEMKELTSRSAVFYDEGERIFRKSPCSVVMVKNQAMVENLYKELV
jgi:nucleotide-binding universal stress UspA family protein